jgi:hypothetical protein
MVFRESSIKLQGYKISPSDKYFPKSWGVLGIQQDGQTQKIHETKSDPSICSQYPEKIFTVSDFPPYQGFKIMQTGSNSQRTNNFSLSGIEFFGLLIKT